MAHWRPFPRAACRATCSKQTTSVFRLRRQGIYSAKVDSRNQKHIDVGGQIKRAYALFMYAMASFSRATLSERVLYGRLIRAYTPNTLLVARSFCRASS